jgi:hypothetical protein
MVRAESILIVFPIVSIVPLHIFNHLLFIVGTLKVAGDITITPPSSYEQSIIPQLETPKLSVGQGGAVFRGNIELDKGYAMKIGRGGSFEIEKGPSLFSNEDSSTLVILRSNTIQHWQHHATVLIQQKKLPEQPNFESPHIEAFLGESSVFKVCWSPYLFVPFRHNAFLSYYQPNLLMLQTLIYSEQRTGWATWRNRSKRRSRSQQSFAKWSILTRRAKGKIR